MSEDSDDASGKSQSGGASAQQDAAPSAADRAGLRPRDITVGVKDQCGRQVTWVYWSTQDYAIYQWSRQVAPGGALAWLTRLHPKGRGMHTEYGISPHFTRDDQRLRYA